MKISIWQQFSSNHSSDFSVVGVFATEAEAQAAYEVWHQLFLDIYDWEEWIEKNKRDKVLLRGYDYDSPSTPELLIQRKYGLQWEESFNWLGWRDDLPEALGIMGKYVFVNTIRQTLHWSRSVADLMDKLGSAKTYEQRNTNHLNTRFTCTAIREISAIYLEGMTNAHLEGEIAPPWIEFAESEWIVRAKGSVQRNGVALTFDLVFNAPFYAIPAFTAYLKANGCTDVAFEITGVVRE